MDETYTPRREIYQGNKHFCIYSYRGRTRVREDNDLKKFMKSLPEYDDFDFFYVFERVSGEFTSRLVGISNLEPRKLERRLERIVRKECDVTLSRIAPEVVPENDPGISLSL